MTHFLIVCASQKTHKGVPQVFLSIRPARAGVSLSQRKLKTFSAATSQASRRVTSLTCTIGKLNHVDFASREKLTNALKDKGKSHPITPRHHSPMSSVTSSKPLMLITRSRLRTTFWGPVSLALGLLRRYGKLASSTSSRVSFALLPCRSEASFHPQRCFLVVDRLTTTDTPPTTVPPNSTCRILSILRPCSPTSSPTKTSSTLFRRTKGARLLLRPRMCRS